MSGHGERHPEGALSGPWWCRRGLWINLGMLVALLASVPLVRAYRATQFGGYGLAGVYYESRNWTGMVWRRSLDRFFDISSEAGSPEFEREVFSVAWTGTIVMPRPGYYTFALESDDGSTLEIDGRMVVNNGGTHGLRKRASRQHFAAGAHAIRMRYFQAGMGGAFRAYWSPAGRRGGLEPISPTLLFPEPPGRADLSRAHPTPPRDFAAAMLFFGVLALACLVWARDPLRRWVEGLRTRPAVRLDAALFLLLLGGALAMRLWGLSAAGRTWDEDVYWTAGHNFLESFLGGVFRAGAWSWNSEHPALAKWLYGPATLLSDHFGPARAVSAVAGALTCGLLFLAGRDMFSRRVGLLAAALCVVLPHVVAHNRIIGLETPTGLLYTAAVWLFYRGMRGSGNSAYHLLAGLAVGLVAATRISNLSVVLVVVVGYLLVHGREIRRTGAMPMPVTLGLLPVAAMGVFVLIWPYLWDNPMMHIGEMLSHWKPDIYLEWYLGSKQKPNGYYYPLYFAVTMPAGVLLTLPLFLVRMALRRAREHLWLVVWFLSPFVVMLSPLARDGVRYLYPSLVAACLIWAAGIDWLAQVLGDALRRPRLCTPLLALLGGGLVCYVGVQSARVQPYQLDYYNELVGGPRRVARRHLFEIAWWGEGLREAVAYVDRHAPAGAKVKVYVHPTHVVTLRPDLRWWNDARTADYIMFNNLFNTLPDVSNHRLVHVVRVAGGPMVWIYQRKGLTGVRGGESP